MAIGATFCRSDCAQATDAEISALAADPDNPVREFHWAEMGKKQLGPYQKLVTRYVQAIVEYRLLRYNCLVVHNRKLDHRGYSGGDRDLTLTKFIFSHVYGFVSRFGPNSKFEVFLDKRDTKHPPEKMKHALNNRLKTEFDMANEPVKNVDFVSSQDSQLIQATDVITGAIAYEKNGRHRAQSPAPHKVALWQQVKTCTRINSLANPPLRYPFHFKIRDFDFSKSKSAKRK